MLRRLTSPFQSPFQRWVTLSEHKWVTSGKRRGSRIWWKRFDETIRRTSISSVRMVVLPSCSAVGRRHTISPELCIHDLTKIAVGSVRRHRPMSTGAARGRTRCYSLLQQAKAKGVDAVSGKRDRQSQAVSNGIYRPALLVSGKQAKESRATAQQCSSGRHWLSEKSGPQIGCVRKRVLQKSTQLRRQARPACPQVPPSSRLPPTKVLVVFSGSLFWPRGTR
jgi:hypothetical protein